MEENKNEEVVETREEYETGNRGVKISDDVVAVIAGVAVSEVSGVANMQAGFATGISEALSGKKNRSKGIKVEISDNTAKIDKILLKIFIFFLLYFIIIFYIRLISCDTGSICTFNEPFLCKCI